MKEEYKINLLIFARMHEFRRLCVSTLIVCMCFDLDEYLSGSIISDFVVADYSILSMCIAKNINGVTQDFLREARSPSGNPLRSYNPERTICDLIRSRRYIEAQELQSAIKEYVRLKDKNVPLLMRYAKAFSVVNTGTVLLFIALRKTRHITKSPS